jgi:hypothetical protein
LAALEPVAVSDAQLVRLRPERVVALRRRA